MVFLRQFHAKFHMGAFLFTIYRFTNIMEQASPFCHIRVCTDFRRKNTCKVGSIDTVLENVLSITRSIFQTPQYLNQIRMHAANSTLEYRFFTGLTNRFIHFFLCLCHNFLNSCRMDSSIFHKTFQGQSGNFTANRIETGQNNRFRCIINNQINTGQCFNCAYIPPFTSDNTALHFFIRQGNYRNRCFRNCISSVSLNSSCYDFTRFVIRSQLDFFFCRPDTDRLFMCQLIINAGKNHFLRLITGKM